MVVNAKMIRDIGVCLLRLSTFYVIMKLREGTFPALVVSSDTGRRKAGQDILKPGEADTCAASATQLQSSHARQPQHSCDFFSII